LPKIYKRLAGFNTIEYDLLITRHWLTFESEGDFLYSVLLWNNHLPIRYRHRKSGRTTYRLQARPAPTGPGLRL